MSLKLESLEGRDVPAADVFFNGPNLVISADGGDNVAFVSEAGGLVFVNVNGVDFGPLPRDAVGLVTFEGGAGDDAFVNATTAYAVASGGFGQDILVGGNFGNALVGGPGADILVGGVSGDVLLGESGDDILFGGPGADALFGGPGFNQFLDLEPFDVVDDSAIVFFGGGFDSGFEGSYDEYDYEYDDYDYGYDNSGYDFDGDDFEG